MGQIIFKGAEVKSAGMTLQNAGYGSTTSVSLDLSGCGSSTAASAASDFAMWASTMLVMNADDVVGCGGEAIDAASVFEGTDASLAKAVNS